MYRILRFLIITILCLPSEGFKSFVSKTYVPDIKKRELMNLVLVNSLSFSCLPLVGGYLYFLMPKIENNGDFGLKVKDKNSLDVNEREWIGNHPYPNRDLVQGLNGDPHYLITNKDNNLENYAINAICTHLGCVVPWNEAEQKFMCPCHGSQYDKNGKVIRGPAPNSLKLGKISIEDNYVFIQNWKDIDFRDSSEPWWM